MHDDAPLPGLHDSAIQRVRSLWRLLAWQVLPEALAGPPGAAPDQAVPDGPHSAFLAAVRCLHGGPVAAEAVQHRDAARQSLSDHLHAMMTAQGPKSRLDLAMDALGLDARERLVLELVTVTHLDPGTSQAARVLAGRMQRFGSHDPDLLDDVLAAAGLSAGLVRDLCGPLGRLRRLGAIQATELRTVAPSSALLAAMDGRPLDASPLQPFEVQSTLPPAALQSLADLRAGWLRALDAALAARRPVLLSGAPGFGGVALALLLGQARGIAVRALDVRALLDLERGELTDRLPALHAECRLLGSLHVLARWEQLEGLARDKPALVTRLVQELAGIGRPVVLVHEGPVAPDLAALLAVHAGAPHLEVPGLQPTERAALLTVCLQQGGVPQAQADDLAQAVATITLGAEPVVAAAAAALQKAQVRVARILAEGKPLPPLVPTPAELRLACAAASTSRLRQYGSRVDTVASWEDLVLAGDALQAVKELARFARVRDRLFSQFGFGEKMSYGRALSAMFSGPSGTGKTMVAGLIAKDLGVELYRVDLSRVVSKYIGETEERLGALFSEAAQSGAALLFDEADSMFGQRTDIKSSNDRYANLEVNYLLQRLEEFDGVVILTTNFASSIDEAFVRRLRFRVQFPFPTSHERARLWEVMLPPGLPVDPQGIDFAWLGDVFELSGGHVRNAILRAAMLAADADRPLTQRMIYDAAAAEYRELGKLAPAYALTD